MPKLARTSCRLPNMAAPSYTDMTGFMGRTGLCPGQITRQDGSTEYAYRFIELTEEDCVSLIDQLDEMIHEHMVQSL